MSDKLRVAIVGCGNIAKPYARTMKAYRNLELLGASDLIPERAQELAAEFGGQVYPTLDDLLADDRVDVVVNLTIHHAHPMVIAKCLDAGKHVHSEKPLAMTYGEARGLVEMAEAKGLRLSCSPITYMGEAQQTAWRHPRGAVRQARVVYAGVNHGRIGPAPEPGALFTRSGLFDVGVHPLTLVTTFLAPPRSYRLPAPAASGPVTRGPAFHVDPIDLAAIELADGRSCA